jgi:hypothetical protein
LVFLYRVNPVNPVKNGNSYTIELFHIFNKFRSIELVHSTVQAGEQNRLDRLGAAQYHFMEYRPLFGISNLENIVFHRFSVEGPAYSKFKPREILRTKLRNNGSDTPVSAGTPASSQAHATGRQIEIIVDYEHLASGNSKIPEDLSDSLTASVHISERLDKQDLAPPKFTLTPTCAELTVLKDGTQRSGQTFQYTEAQIMPGGFVFLSRIAQPNDRCNVFFTL